MTTATAVGDESSDSPASAAGRGRQREAMTTATESPESVPTDRARSVCHRSLHGNDRVVECGRHGAPPPGSRPSDGGCFLGCFHSCLDVRRWLTVASVMVLHWARRCELLQTTAWWSDYRRYLDSERAILTGYRRLSEHARSDRMQCSST